MKKLLLMVCTVAFFAVAANAQDTKTKAADKTEKSCCAKKADGKACSKDAKTADAKACCSKSGEAKKDCCAKKAEAKGEKKAK